MVSFLKSEAEWFNPHHHSPAHEVKGWVHKLHRSSFASPGAWGDTAVPWAWVGCLPCRQSLPFSLLIDCCPFSLILTIFQLFLFYFSPSAYEISLIVFCPLTNSISKDSSDYYLLLDLLLFHIAFSPISFTPSFPNQDFSYLQIHFLWTELCI